VCSPHSPFQHRRIHLQYPAEPNGGRQLHQATALNQTRPQAIFRRCKYHQTSCQIMHTLKRDGSNQHALDADLICVTAYSGAPKSALTPGVNHSGNKSERMTSVCQMPYFDECINLLDELVSYSDRSSARLSARFKHFLFAHFNCKMPALFPGRLLFMIQHHYPRCEAGGEGRRPLLFPGWSTRIHFYLSSRLFHLFPPACCVSL